MRLFSAEDCPACSPKAFPPCPRPAALSSNCSCNCLAPKVLLLAEGWPQGDQLVAALKDELGQLPAPAPYYPGIRQRHEAFRQAYPQVGRAPLPPPPCLPLVPPPPCLSPWPPGCAAWEIARLAEACSCLTAAFITGSRPRQASAHLPPHAAGRGHLVWAGRRPGRQLRRAPALPHQPAAGLPGRPGCRVCLHRGALCARADRGQGAGP